MPDDPRERALKDAISEAATEIMTAIDPKSILGDDDYDAVRDSLIDALGEAAREAINLGGLA